jgi:hypothetical protein
MVSAALFLEKGRRPEIISYKTTPSEKMSGAPAFSPRTCAGDMYPIVSVIASTSISARVMVSSCVKTLGCRSARPKSRIFDAPVGREEDVGRLDVAMNNVPGMRGGQTFRHCRGDFNGFASRDGSAAQAVTESRLRAAR